MKNLKKVALIAAIVMANVSMVLASDEKDSEAQVRVRQIQSEHKIAVVQVTNLKAEQSAVLRIKDRQGNVLHREALKQKQAHARKYDFSHLPVGEYSIEVRTRDGYISQSFSLEEVKTNPITSSIK